jgi:hypothetical protein
MKLLATLGLLILALSIKAQIASTTVTMTGMGDIKLGMKKADFEKMLNQKFKMAHLSSKNDEYYQDTVHINYKGLEADVVFQKEYTDSDKYDITIWEIRSNSPQIKTKSGIGIGDDKYKIISTYEDFTIWIMPEYENNYTIKSKTKSTIWLHGDSGNVIIFYLDSNKVTGMSVTYDEGD